MADQTSRYVEGTSDTLNSSEGSRLSFLIHERYLRYIDFVRRWQTKLLETRKVPQIHLLRQEGVKLSTLSKGDETTVAKRQV